VITKPADAEDEGADSEELELELERGEARGATRCCGAHRAEDD